MSDTRSFTIPPVTIPLVPTSATRVPVQQPPYTIINLSTTGTAYLASDSSVQVGTGTPINPGTALQWNTPGELYAIGSEALNIQISYDVTDWEPDPVALAVAILNSGLVLIDQPEVVVDANTTTGAFEDFGPFDTSRFQSVLVRFQSVPADNTEFDTLQLEFKASGVTVLMREIAVNSDRAFQGCFPIIGDTLEVRAINNTSSTLTTTVVLSNRSYNMLQTIENSTGTNFWDFHFDNVSIGASNFILKVVPAYFGTISVEVQGGAAGADVTVSIQEPIPGGGLRSRQRLSGSVQNGTLIRTGEYAVHGQGSIVRVDNNTGSSLPVNIKITPLVGSQGIT